MVGSEEILRGEDIEEYYEIIDESCVGSEIINSVFDDIPLIWFL